ncbi:MAG: ABC transporter permease, partial [Bdellovibrionaceae bacterium]|nr:ABC transporter permease [Pseudobdellovibrionaceae bacterium]
QSVSAQMIGFEPHLETELISKEMIIEGATFTPPAKPGQIVYEAAVGEGLARLLRAKPGQTLTIIGQTADGGINAIDAEIKFLFRTVVQEIDDTTVYVPLSLSQKVLDSDGAERVVIKLKDHDMVGEMLPKVKAILPEGTQARGWRELSRLYNQTERYFETQNAVVAGIILALILLSITSTVGMSVSERTGEIGTMRALGDTKPAILRLFAFEGLLLGGIGGVIGAILGYAISVVLTAVKVPIVLPGATQPIPVRVLQLPSAYILAFILTVFAAFLATMIAARRASQMNIVDALKKNV